MNLEPSAEQKLLQETLSRIFREQSTGVRIRQCEQQGTRAGFDVDLWKTLSELEVPMLRVPGDLGGDASLMHAVLVAEETGRHLASVPLVEAIVVNRLLAKLGAPCKSLLEQSASGAKVVTLALHDVAANPKQLVPAGAIADAVVCLDSGLVTVWTEISRTAQQIHGAVPALSLDALKPGQRTTIDVASAAALFAEAVEEWKLLMAVQVAAAARRALELAGEYSGQREAFGKKIGEFQGLAHPLANALTDVEGAQLLAWRAVDAIARGEKDAASKVSMAYWWAGKAARPAALLAMRVFGGYGMTMEYDAQLYFRRINAWSLLAGPTDFGLDEVASRLWAGEKVALPDAGEVVIDYGWGAEAEAVAARMHAICKSRHDQKMRDFMRDSLDGFDRELNSLIAAEGLLYADAPKEFGGLGLSGTVAAAVRDAYGDYYWNLLAPNVTDMVAKTVQFFGKEEAKKELLPLLYSAKAYCTLGYSEPSGGSDIFAAKTTAVRDTSDKNAGEDADWLVNGQKMFTSTAHLADYALMLLRTGPDKYRGVTMFIVPLKQPGFQLTEIKTIGDERTNVTFYSDVRVPDKYRIGEVNGGVKVMAMALTIEQASGDLHVMSMKLLLRQALQWAQDGSFGPAPMERSEVRRALAETAVRLEVQDALNRRCVWGAEAKTLRKHHGPMAKLFGSESWMSTAARLMEVAAPESLVVKREAEGGIEWLLRRAIPSTVYAGSSEIQRSLIAESGLGTPRSR
jgi:alkylation response protein AidB-like acyl-CoA dehydrogenase